MSPHLLLTLSTTMSIIVVDKSLTNGHNFAFSNKQKKGMRSVVSIPYSESRNKRVEMPVQEQILISSHACKNRRKWKNNGLWKRENGKLPVEKVAQHWDHQVTSVHPKVCRAHPIYRQLCTEKAARRMKSLRCILICFKHNIAIPLL